MTARPTLRLALLAGGAVLALYASAAAQPQPAPALAPAQAAPQRDPAFVDLSEHNARIEEWRQGRQAELRRLGQATAENFRKIDEEALTRARAAESHRTRALDALSKQSGVTIQQGAAGTQPAQGRGSLGDVDTASLSPKDFQKSIEAAKKAGYTVVQQGDAFTIKELDTTVHRAPTTRASTTGSSGRASEIARGANPETAMGLGADDPAISVSDNLKKGARTVNTPSDAISSSDLQKLGKMTGRNADAVTQVTGQGVDPATRAQADLLKQGYSPEAAGIVRDNATPAQRAQDIADFQSRAKQVNVEAAKAADLHAGRRMETLASEARHANEVLEATRGTGDPARIAKARANADAANRAVIEYAETRAAAQASAVVNDPDAARIVAEARGQPTQGKSPSQIREAALGPERKTLTSAVAEPTRAPGVRIDPVKGAGAEPVKAPGAAEAGAEGGLRSKAMKGAGGLLAIWAVLHGVERAAQEAGAEAGEHSDSAAKSTLKTLGYSVWHGLGFGAAADAGRRSGEESAQQWAKDVREGKVDPTSELSRKWAQIRAVGWGIAEFTGLQAIKDATMEGAGYVKDRYGQYQSEKAEAAAKAEKEQGGKAADSRADAAKGDPKAAGEAGGGKTDPVAKDKGADKPGAAIAAAGAKESRAAQEKTKDAEQKAQADAQAQEKAKEQAKAKERETQRKADKERAEKAAAAKAQQEARDKAAKVLAAQEKAAQEKAAREAQAAAEQAAREPAPGTTEVEGGWVKDAKGTTKVVYINNSRGERIGGYYVTYDPNGREIGRERFTIDPPEPQGGQQPDPAAALAGRYVGRISGQAGGSFEMTVSGASVSGRIVGVFKGDSFSSTFSGAIDADGGFSATARGVLQGKWSDSVKPYPFNGAVSGRVDGQSGSGRWSGKNQWGGASGAWSARK